VVQRSRISGKYSIENRRGRLPPRRGRNASSVLKLEFWAFPVERPDRQTLGQVVSQTELISRRGGWKHTGQGVVCAYGCFDLLHPGHIRLLEHARSLGSILVVAIERDAALHARPTNGDSPIKRQPARPVTPASERAEILAALDAVDFVVVLESDSAQPFLLQLSPDIVTVGGNPSADSAARRDAAELERVGCKIVRVPLEPGYSTARLIDRIRELRA
jgi:rfaE bifunctional protein nucleotidyltransferase chain/domain